MASGIKNGINEFFSRDGRYCLAQASGFICFLFSLYLTARVPSVPAYGPLLHPLYYLSLALFGGGVAETGIVKKILPPKGNVQ